VLYSIVGGVWLDWCRWLRDYFSFARFMYRLNYRRRKKRNKSFFISRKAAGKIPAAFRLRSIENCSMFIGTTFFYTFDHEI
jgi:hypothetical protein